MIYLGTMSGGGNRPIKGRMSSKLQIDVTPQQIAKVKEKLKFDEQAFQVTYSFVIVW